jgi:predicted metal-dependent HD superfamily phosphohydrolase
MDVVMLPEPRWIPPERLDRLQSGWLRALEPLDLSPTAAYAVFDQLVEHYEAPTRFYHNLEHIDEMLKVVGRLRDVTADPLAVTLAIWFHDALYTPGAADNESRSADYATTALAAWHAPANLSAQVARLILATQHRTDFVPLDGDTAVVLDADLAILGTTEARYDRYAAAIRQEYAAVPDEAYRAGRATVLQGFLARERLYWSERVFAEGESRARANLARELAGIG